ncbi:MAG: XisI protein [Anaerolineae bacterium]|nr:XisI protein [Anaerolineae bacterium]
MDQLKEIVKSEVAWYASGGFNVKTYFFPKEDEQVYAVVAVDWPVRHYPASVVVLARIEGDMVIIEEDTTDRPLVDSLVHAGIPREKIIRAYAGETATAAQKG